VPKDTYPVQWVGQQALVALPEYIDVSNAGRIREELLAVLNRGADTLIADMTATVSCDHAGADAVARAYQRAAASRTQLRLVVTSASVLRMLGMTGVGRLVPVYPSVEAALAARSPAANPRPDRNGKRPERPERPEPGIDAGVEVALPPVTLDVLWKMIDAVGDGVALTDGGGTLVLANRQLEKMFGYLPAELTGQPVERLIPAHLQASHRGHLSASSGAPKGRPVGTGAPLTGLRKDGTTFPAEISLSPLPADHGRLALAVVRDVTTDAQQAHRSQELLDAVITALYHVGLGLQAAVDLPPGPARLRIQAELDALDQTISQIRAAVFTDRDR
jgi:anti-anti-sigma factor